MATTPTTGNMSYFYDEQLKRYLLQIVRVFSHFQVREYSDGVAQYNRVPVQYGDSSRMVANILRNNSENVINSAPFIAVSIESLKIARGRMQDPTNVDTQQVAERAWDPDTNSYSSEQGSLYTTKRYMPIPYDLNFKVDIWTTNTDTKLQLIEQIMILFNPGIQLQSDSNPLNWVNVFEMEMTDINWSSRNIPQGVDEALDISTLSFSTGIWISPPAKVKRQTIIQRIITDLHNTSSVADLNFSNELFDFFGSIEDTAEIVVTPNNYRIRVDGTIITLLDNNGMAQSWSKLIEMQGNLSATSILKLNITNDTDDESTAVVGYVAATVDDTELLFTLDVDTLPADTITNVARIIDARSSSPGVSGLPAASVGQRYLLVSDISAAGYPLWNITAKENDIIEYNGSNWFVSFDYGAHSIAVLAAIADDDLPDLPDEYVTNTTTSIQYKWTADGWISSYEGTYREGYWRLIL